MTQTLDLNERTISDLDAARGAMAPAATTGAAVGRFGAFAITFGISFVILYTLFERMNWPLFTYHPAVGKLDFWMHAARSGEGPPMYWYGWIVLAALSALVLGLAATMISPQRLQRLTLFCCALAILWSIAYQVAVVIADRPSYDTEFMDLVWMSAAPALVGAVAVGYFSPLRLAERLWTSWLLILPLGGLIILGNSLKEYFLR